MKKKIEDFVKEGWFYIMLTHPTLYITKLLTNVTLIGIITFIFTLIYQNTLLHEFVIPAAMHSIAGLVIGLLLVFRTNTSYDRWWEARKSIEAISNMMSFMCSVVRTAGLSRSERDVVVNELDEASDAMQLMLCTTDPTVEREAKFATMSRIGRAIAHVRKHLGMEMPAQVDASMKDMFLQIGNCSRIKNTPIPMSYALHIKISVFLYIVTLPFGLLIDMGLWATPMVMVLFYIISGIEIISNEIENPFHGDPNDLPVAEYIDEMRRSYRTELIDDVK